MAYNESTAITDLIRMMAVRPSTRPTVRDSEPTLVVQRYYRLPQPMQQLSAVAVLTAGVLIGIGAGIIVVFV